MADTIENITRDESFGKSWKSRFRNKWPTMTTLMQQSEITIQPYMHEFTDPHEIMAYRTCKIPDWDESSQASWAAAQSIPQDMLEESSATEMTEGINEKERRCEKSCRYVLCIFLILSIVMATAAAIGLSVFLNLHNHGLADRQGHHHGNHIHSNITTDQGIYLSKLFCNVVKHMLRRTDFPVERGLGSCHAALLFIENSEDLHIEMHVSPMKGYTIKEKILRALKEGVLQDKNSRSKTKERKKSTFTNGIRKGFSTLRPRTNGSQSTLSRVVHTEKYDNVEGTTIDPSSITQSTSGAVLQEVASVRKDFVTSVRPIVVSNTVTSGQVVSITTSSQDLVSSQNVTNLAIPTTLPSIILEKSLTIADKNPFDKTMSFPRDIVGQDPQRLETNSLGKTTSLPPIIGEHDSTQTDTNSLGKTTSLPPVIADHHSTQSDTNSVENTTSFPPVIVEHHSTQSDTNSLGKTTSLPPVSVEHHSTQSDTNSLGKTTSLPPVIVDHHSTQSDTNSLGETTSLPQVIVEHHSTQSDTNSLDKTTSLPPFIIKHRSTQSDTNSLGETTSLPPIIVEHHSTKSDTNPLDKPLALPANIFEENPIPSDTNYFEKITPLPPFFVEYDPQLLNTQSLGETSLQADILVDKSKQSDTNYSEKQTLLPPVVQHKLIPSDMNYLDKTTSLPPIIVEHDRMPVNTNSPSQLKDVATIRSQDSNTRFDRINSTVAQNNKQLWNEIPKATKLFNPEPLDLVDTTVNEKDISNANRENMNQANQKSPKIVESLMSGGVMKLPFKTNSNFRFLFSSDSKVKSTNQHSSSKPEINEKTQYKEVLSNNQNSHEIDSKKNKDNFNTQNDQVPEHTPSTLFTKKPRSPDLFRTIRLPASSTKSVIQRKTTLPKKPKRRLDLTEFGEPSFVFR